jgi:hypothetical protein
MTQLEFYFPTPQFPHGLAFAAFAMFWFIRRT